IKLEIGVVLDGRVVELVVVIHVQGLVDDRRGVGSGAGHRIVQDVLEGDVVARIISDVAVLVVDHGVDFHVAVGIDVGEVVIRVPELALELDANVDVDVDLGLVDVLVLVRVLVLGLVRVLVLILVRGLVLVLVRGLALVLVLVFALVFVLVRGLVFVLVFVLGVVRVVVRVFVLATAVTDIEFAVDDLQAECIDIILVEVERHDRVLC
ncbi:MAG: hypothetical protein E5W86_03060, partial [Mesorhizobium sp.]